MDDHWFAGRCSFTRRLHGPADKITFSHSGDYYLFISNKQVHVHRASDNLLLVDLTDHCRINQAVFFGQLTGQNDFNYESKSSESADHRLAEKQSQVSCLNETTTTTSSSVEKKFEFNFATVGDNNLLILYNQLGMKVSVLYHSSSLFFILSDCPIVRLSDCLLVRTIRFFQRGWQTKGHKNAVTHSVHSTIGNSISSIFLERRLFLGIE